MRTAVREDVLICILEIDPTNTNNTTPPTAYIQSDGGHGGLESIKFCPFCGKKITITQS
jgi:hypothetical protein